MMNRHLAISLLAASCLGGYAAKAQGLPDPVAAPGPSMKTLQQIQPSQPFPTQDPAQPDLQSPPYVLNQPGRYILTRNLEHSTNSVTPAIIILAPGVEVDFSGYSIYNGNDSTYRAVSSAVHAVEINVDGYPDPLPVILRNGMIWGAIAPAIDARGVDLIIEDMIIDTVGGVETEGNLTTRRTTLYGNYSRAAQTDAWIAKDCLIRGSAISGSQMWTDVICYPVLHRSPGFFWSGLTTGVAVDGPARWERVIYSGFYGSNPDLPVADGYDLFFGPGSRFEHSILDTLNLHARRMVLGGSTTFEGATVRNFRMDADTNLTDAAQVRFSKSALEEIRIGPNFHIDLDRSLARELDVFDVPAAPTYFTVNESNLRVYRASLGVNLTRGERSFVHHRGGCCSPTGIGILGKVSRCRLTADYEEYTVVDYLYTASVDSRATLENSVVLGWNAVSVTNRLYANVIGNTVRAGNVGIDLRMVPAPPQMAVVRDNAVWVTGSGDGTPWTLLNQGENSVIRGNIALGAPISTSVAGFYGTLQTSPGIITVGGMGNIVTP